uniref:Germ cell-less, spermatogenesis associated n=1 Tax=Xiphophorus couchianus TaxID=32473 RepID=A0A3B5L6D2_9TELE
MGNLSSRFQSPSQGPEESAEGTISSRRHGCECKKRKRNAQCDCDSEQEEEDDILDTPRRKKLKSTSKYIYQTLFLNGENSDIRICALGQEWNLHKVYNFLKFFFTSLFQHDGNQLGDSRPEHRPLQVVFGSLYRDDVLIKPSRVISILAAACMLQLDGLIQQCGETMKENISSKTVCGFYVCASIYGLDSVMKKCLEWLLNNLMTHQNVDLMKELGYAFCMEKENLDYSNICIFLRLRSVFHSLKNPSSWMFLQLNSSWDGPIKQLLADADAWLCKRRTDLCEKEPFLNTEEGAPFRSVFRLVRLQYIINDLASARILERDNILPPEWLTAMYKNQWFAMLRTEFDNDNGPQEPNKDEFEKNSMRCGRKLSKDGDYCWRWTGFNFGFDLLVTYTNRFIVFKRNTLSQPCGGAVSLQSRRHLAYRLRLASFDSRGKLVCSRSTGYQLLTLEKDQEYVVMNLDSRLLSFPLYVCCNFLYTSPHSDHRPDSSEPESATRTAS